MKNSEKVKPLLISIIILLAVISIAILFNTFSGKEVLQMEENTAISEEEAILNEILAMEEAELTALAKQETSMKAELTSNSDKEEIKKLVGSFGSKLQHVSLLAPKDILEKDMEEHYGDYVSKQLIEKWVKDPMNAPGRKVSSPWPERIDIISIDKVADVTYEVEGEIIEITSVEKKNGGFASKQAITLLVKKIDNRWLIDDVELGKYENSSLNVYKNTEYGFEFNLPTSWDDYTIVTSEWEGISLGDSQSSEIVEKGPIISIRHPLWTEEEQRQDIPIMIFTITQWESYQRGDYSIGAVPVDPIKLGNNSRYVFLLPARYNFAFPTGYEEVQDIINSSPLKPTEEDTLKN